MSLNTYENSLNKIISNINNKDKKKVIDAYNLAKTAHK
jgi:hypothetical protein